MRASIHGAWATIECSPKQSAELYSVFAVEIPHAKFNPRWRKAIRYGGWDGKAHFFNRLTNKIPAGLLPMLQEAYPNLIIENPFVISEELQSKRLKKLEVLKVNGIQELGEHQRIGIQRAVTIGSGILDLATNSGKTILSASIIKILNKPTLYVIHRKALLHQTAEEFENRLGIKCGLIGDGKFDIRKVTIAIINSLPKMVKKNAPFYDQFKVLIMDEGHHTSATTWYKIALGMKAKYRFVMTGTPWTGNDLKDMRLISCFGSTVLASIRNKELIKQGWSATPSVHIWPAPYSENEMPWSVAYDMQIVGNTDYNESIIELVKKKWEQGLTTLLLVNRIQHGTRLYRRLKSERVDCVFLTGSSDGNYLSKSLKRFKEEKLGVIIATPIFDEGVDVPAIRCLVLAGGGKAPIALMQRVGRALRKKKTGSNTTEIHDFLHFGNPFLLKHSQKRIEIFRKEEFDITFHEPKELVGSSKKYSETGSIDWHSFHKEGQIL